MRRKKKFDYEPDHKYKRFEDILAQINPFGAFQIFVCICIIFVQIEWAGNFSFINVMGSIEPSFECSPNNESNIYLGSSPFQIDPPFTKEKCYLLKNNCTNVSPIKNSTEFNSIVATFQLICDFKDIPEIIQILQALSLVIYLKICIFLNHQRQLKRKSS